jgi:hypothetical protein
MPDLNIIFNPYDFFPRMVTFKNFYGGWRNLEFLSHILQFSQFFLSNCTGFEKPAIFSSRLTVVYVAYEDQVQVWFLVSHLKLPPF